MVKDTRAIIRRRNNAPIRPRPGAPVAADFAFALAGGTFVMAGIFAIVSLSGMGLAGGDAGADLARMFAASLVVVSACAALIAVMLVAGTHDASARAIAPIVIGTAIGTLEALLIIEGRIALLPLPLALLLFVPLPVRRILRIGARR